MDKTYTLDNYLTVDTKTLRSYIGFAFKSGIIQFLDLGKTSEYYRVWHHAKIFILFIEKLSKLI